ncbi:hypothetical protein EST38_g1914 [Candolleomyces aberdarensis]|uniref:Uncharacterized protein n=1 Tax=Candolleomyces aberdarensis TaxID=2316362 RepID=A0A4Q2DY49_9AGAR|nr:hypothetical protein EST38_g1914 [Candolleomyces aberdarensis]
MHRFRSFYLNSAIALLLAASQLISAAIVWEPYLEGYRDSLQNFGTFNGRHIGKPGSGLRKSRPVVDVNGNTIPGYDVVYEFDQLIDHNNASRGTFKTRYYHTWEYYREGGPIILFTPGERPIDMILDGSPSITNASIAGAIAQATNGAVVVLEHRFYGESYPFPDLSVDGLKFHTISQALQDFVYFARNVKLAMPGGDGEGIRPHRSPWIFVGGSYAGALAAFIVEQHPGVFWAAYSSAGVVQPKIDFWQYWTPVEQHMPANCTADTKAVVSLIDEAIDSGNQTRRLDIVYRCSELGWYQTGPPNGGGIISKHLNAQAWATFCSEAFPGTLTNSLTEFQARVDAALQQYKGWSTMADRVFIVNGRRDPWLEVTLSATEANISSTDLRPIYLTNGFHCSDMTYVNAIVEPSLGEVWNQALTTFPRWVSDFNGRQGSSASEVGMSPFRLGMVVASAALAIITVL